MLEIFWPNVIKQQIAKYEAEGTLNQACVENLKRTSVKFTIIGIVLALFLQRIVNSMQDYLPFWRFR